MREKLRMAVIGETKKSIKRLSSTVGIRSRLQELFGKEEKIIFTCMSNPYFGNMLMFNIIVLVILCQL